MRHLDDSRRASPVSVDVVVAMATEPRGSSRCLEVLRHAQLFVIDLRAGGDEVAYQRLVHRDCADIVWPLFSWQPPASSSNAAA
jgi:hypothetical protein